MGPSTAQYGWLVYVVIFAIIVVAVAVIAAWRSRRAARLETRDNEAIRPPE